VLKLARCDRLKDDGLKQLFSSLTNLLVVDLCKTQAKDESVLELARNNPFLTDVNLEQCRLTGCSVLELAGLQQLRKLVLIDVVEVPDTVTLHLVKNAPSLEELHISERPNQPNWREELRSLKPSLALFIRKPS